MSSKDLHDIKDLKYVGEKRANLYRKLGIDTIKDLLYHCPRSYIDLTNTSDISSVMLEETATIKVFVTQKFLPLPTRKRGLTIYKFVGQDKTGRVNVTLFNEPFTFDRIEIGKKYILFGKINSKVIRDTVYCEMTSPMVVDAEDKNLIQPVYQLTAGLTSKIVSRNVYDALEVPGIIDEYLPDWILKEAGLIDLRSAIELIHFPKKISDIEKAKKRIVFDELFIFSLGLILIKKNNLKKTSAKMEETDISEFYEQLPYSLTSAQQRVIKEIIKDMSSFSPMNRLLQGDVGSGKTAVAMAALYLASKNKIQSAFMVPTEILARQHFNLISKFLDGLGVSVGLLVGSMSAKEKSLVKDRLMVGALDVVIGTHALIQDDVFFDNLGLVITDEQHRFGVRQRARLSEKGSDPHKLIMSATPIPRTLSMIMYGDLDISIIDERPSNRLPVLTYYINANKRKRAYEFVRKLLDEGRQAYIVCPLIDQNESLDLKSVIEYGQILKEKEFSDYEVAIIHGKTRPDEKDFIMQDFKEKKINLLISTTVIEVGIDVPEATVIVIEDADRFGLSQLHQLRGRVGRGQYQSYCILISDSKSIETINKLKMMTKTDDGFKISEYDLEIRGPGDFFGDRQHGLPKFKNFDMLRDVKLLKLTQDMVMKVLDDDVSLDKEENRCLKSLILEKIDNAVF